MKKLLRVYADTSVFGGCFDDEFKIESVRFFEEVREGQFVVVVSNITLDELELAPDSVRGVLAILPPEQVEIVSTSPESDALRNAYLEAAVVGPASSNDAAHIAVATISSVDLVKDQLKDHQAEVRDFSAEAQSGTDANVKTFASNVLPTLQQHLDQVKGLNKSEKNK